MRYFCTKWIEIEWHSYVIIMATFYLTTLSFFNLSHFIINIKSNRSTSDSSDDCGKEIYHYSWIYLTFIERCVISLWLKLCFIFRLLNSFFNHWYVKIRASRFSWWRRIIVILIWVDLSLLRRYLNIEGAFYSYFDFHQTVTHYLVHFALWRIKMDSELTKESILFTQNLKMIQ